MTEQEELEKRLREARAKRLALEQVREEREVLRQLQAEVAVEERGVRDAEALTKAEAEHGPVGSHLAVVHTLLGAIIVKRPHPVAFRRFLDLGNTKMVELEKLVRPCLVYPDADTFDRILEEQPAALMHVANAVVELAGLRTQEVSPK